MRTLFRLWMVAAFFLTIADSITNHAALAQSVATDLAIQVSSPDPNIPAPGSFVRFNVRVSNLGLFGSFLSSRVTTRLPAEYTDISWSCAADSAPQPAERCGSNCHVPACPVPNMGVGNLDANVGLSAQSALMFTIRARVPENTPNPLVLSALIAPSFGIIDPIQSNNQDQLFLYKLSDVSMLLQASNNPSIGHEPVGITATVCNSGPYAAESVKVQLDFSKDLVFYSTTGDGWDCSSSTQQAVCERNTLAKNSCSVVQSTIVPVPGVESASMQATASVLGRMLETNMANNAAKLQLSITSPDKPSLSGGGIGCSVHPSSSGFAGTLAMFSLVSLIAAVGRIFYRRKSTGRAQL